MVKMRDPNWTGPGPGPMIDVAEAAPVQPTPVKAVAPKTPMPTSPKQSGASSVTRDPSWTGPGPGPIMTSEEISSPVYTGGTPKDVFDESAVYVPPVVADPVVADPVVAVPPVPTGPVLDKWGRDPSNPKYGVDDEEVKKTDARIPIRAMLKKFGFSQTAEDTLFDVVWGNYTADTVDYTDEAAVTLSIRETDAYKTRFAGNELRRAKGLPDLSIANYIGIEKSYKNSLKVNGIPDDFYDSPEEMAELIAGNVDVQEFNDRLVVARDLAQNAPPEVMAQLTSYYGITAGQLTAYYLDPAKMLPILKEQERAARIGAFAVESGGMSIDRTTAEDLAKRGVTDVAAATGFGNIAKLGELNQGMGGEESISGQDIIGAQFGFNADGTKKLANRKARRLAEFEGGGNFAKSQGIGGAIKSGVGSAE